MTLEESWVEHCAPTLAGLKVASLCCHRPGDLREFALQCRVWREWFGRYGLRLAVLKGCREKKSYLLCLYREKALRRVLQAPENREYLASAGYEIQDSTDGMLAQLARRLRRDGEFPHEIGLFLGYPLEDVKGFVRHKGKNFTCCGCWKAYGDPEAARRLFERYGACTRLYKKRYASGTPVTALIVAA